MSGFEIAGLVLGAFPIAISALQGCCRAAELLDCWREMRREHSKCDREIKYNHIRYISTLKQLLLPLVVDDETICHLMGDPGGESWKASEIADALESRLQDSYGLYVETIKEMQRVMGEITQELEKTIAPPLREGDKQAPQSSGSHGNSASRKPNAGFSMTRFRRRIKQPLGLRRRLKHVLNIGIRSSTSQAVVYLKRAKFIMRESARKRLFKELQAGNDRLDNLLRINDNESCLRRSRDEAFKKGTLSSKTLIGFWQQADLFYKALSESWGCSCRDSHGARLALRHRTTTEKEFQLFLFNGPSGTSRDSSQKWHHCRLRIKAEASAKTRAVELEKAMPPKTSSTHSSPQHRASKPLKSALRNKDKSVLEPGLTTPRITVTLAPPERTSTLQLPEETDNPIPDLCVRLSRIKTPTSQRVGFLEGTETRYEVYPDVASPAEPEFFVTLAEILSQYKSTQFSRKQRYRVALDLSSSFVQLQSTPWITTALRKSTIEFCHDARTAKPTLQLGFPFVTRGFKPLSPLTQSTGVDIGAINALGVILLELCFGEPIEDHPFRKELGGEEANAEVTAAFDVMTALQWQKDVVGEAGPDYADAVEWCLRGFNMSASDASWRREMLLNVVAPLERCNSYF